MLNLAPKQQNTPTGYPNDQECINESAAYDMLHLFLHSVGSSEGGVLCADGAGLKLVNGESTP